MRLKHLQLHGYKTFATKTEFLFPSGITAIIGPNGSGKSNIADAVRWALGEQSFTTLRGKRTEDMIFAGSQSRPRAGMAEVILTLDNSEGWLPVDFSEVTIGRRAYRDRQNEYRLNGNRVRLRDVLELLSQSGLSRRTYTIIGQGVVDAVLSLRAEERRELEEHIRECSSCARELERLRSLSRLFAAAEMPEMSSDALERLHGGVGSVREVFVLRMAETLIAAAAMLLFVCVVWFWQTARVQGSGPQRLEDWEIAAVSMQREGRPEASAEEMLAQWMASDLAGRNGSD